MNPLRQSARKQAKSSVCKFVLTKSSKIPREKPFAWQTCVVQRLKLTALMISWIYSHHALQGPTLIPQFSYHFYRGQKKKTNLAVSTITTTGVFWNYCRQRKTERLYRPELSARYSAFEPLSDRQCDIREKAQRSKSSRHNTRAQCKQLGN